MKRQLLSLFLCAAALGTTVGCLYPERDHRREERREPRRDDERRDRDRDRDRDERHGPASAVGLAQ